MIGYDVMKFYNEKAKFSIDVQSFLELILGGVVNISHMNSIT
jgi:hypothetical protein